MSSAKSVLLLLGIGAIVANAAVGCSATSDSPVGFEEPGDGAAEAAVLPESGVLPSGDSSVAPRPDAAQPQGDASHSDADAALDGALADAGADAAPDAASADAGPPGSSCPTLDAIEHQTCGLCGTQSRLCAPSDGDAASPGVWQPWGFCQNEVPSGCVPGTATTESCGLCGTRNKVCQNDCRYAVGACKNEPLNACQPGAVDFQVGLSCPLGGRSRTCDPTCTFGPFGACFEQGEPTLTLAATAGGKVTGQFTLPAATKTGRLSSSCPSASISGTSTSYGYVTLVNPTASTVVVSVWTGQSTNAGSAYIDTVIASYAGNTAPANDTDRKACLSGVNDTCSDSSDPSACDASWGGLFGTDAVSVPPNGKALIYVAGYYDTSNGDYQLTARTDSLH